MEAEVKKLMEGMGANTSLLRSNANNLPKNTVFGVGSKSGTYFAHENEMSKNTPEGKAQSSNFQDVNKRVIGYPERH